MVAVTLELQDNPYKSILFLYFFCIFINKVIPEENLRLMKYFGIKSYKNSVIIGDYR